MTLRERAEKILGLFIAKESYRDICGEREVLLNTIESELKAAVALAVDEALNQVKTTNSNLFQVVRNEALEKAAQVCEDRGHECPAWCERCKAADEIRALKGIRHK